MVGLFVFCVVLFVIGAAIFWFGIKDSTPQSDGTINDGTVAAILFSSLLCFAPFGVWSLVSFLNYGTVSNISDFSRVIHNPTIRNEMVRKQGEYYLGHANNVRILGEMNTPYGLMVTYKRPPLGKHSEKEIVGLVYYSTHGLADFNRLRSKDSSYVFLFNQCAYLHSSLACTHLRDKLSRYPVWNFGLPESPGKLHVFGCKGIPLPKKPANICSN